jgi:uncharacterized protein YjiS (DUF1127 family)
MHDYLTTANTYGFWRAADAGRNSLRYFLAAVAGWRQRRRLAAELYALNDRMLKDIGISRWEIEWIVNSPNGDHSDRVVKCCR